MPYGTEMQLTESGVNVFITAQWYRFTSAVTDRIPETCVEPGHCGTQWPIWMNGQHPTGNS